MNVQKAALPSIYPMEGTYQISFMHARLGCATPNAVIYYTTDGTEPTLESSQFRPDSEAFTVYRMGTGAQNPDFHMTVKAFSAADGMQNSDVVEFHYHIVSGPVGSFTSEILREGTIDHPAVIKVSDFTRVCMYLLVGSKRAMLIDAGDGSEGDLLGYVNKLTGGLPLDLVIAHAHIDHIGHVFKFQDAGIDVYVNENDIPTFGLFNGKIPTGTKNIADGQVFDLGNGSLTAYLMPGHSAGGIVLLNEENGDLFASDELGNNDPIGPNAGLLVVGGAECCLERYYQSLLRLKEKLNGKAKRIFTAHNYFPINAELYIENAISSVKNVLEKGEEALAPSTRAWTSNCGSASMVSSGEYRTDPSYFGIHPKYLYEKDAVEKKVAKGFHLDYFKQFFGED